MGLLFQLPTLRPTCYPSYDKLFIPGKHKLDKIVQKALSYTSRTDFMN